MCVQAEDSPKLQTEIYDGTDGIIRKGGWKRREGCHKKKEKGDIVRMGEEVRGGGAERLHKANQIL